jgi:voltage-gated potassium channel
MEKLKDKIYEVIFEADTYWGRFFDVALIISVILSVIIVMFETVEELNMQYSQVFKTLEIIFTLLFSIELIFRLYCVKSKRKYLLSFYGLVDLISILPLYLTSIFPFLGSFGVIRALRILRIFRILKLQRYINAGNGLSSALYESRHKIIVFLGFTVTTVFIIGALMYIVEQGQGGGFTSIPKSIYWAVVTITTVGYGDMVPQTFLGKFLSAFLMILGYGVLAIPTGLVSAEMVSQKMKEYEEEEVSCNGCQKRMHQKNSIFCSRCGGTLGG